MQNLYNIKYDEAKNEIIIEDEFTGATLIRTVGEWSQNITILDMLRDYFDNQ